MSNPVWRIIPSCPVYEASSHGEIRRIGDARCKRQHLSKRTYLSVSLWRDGIGNTRYVHRLVCEAFHGPSPKPRMDAAHSDGNKLNNRPDNLRWATRAENEADKIRHKRSNRGQRNGMSKVTDAQAAELRDRAASLPKSSGGAKMKKGALAPLAAQYGLTLAGARLIISRNRRCVDAV